MPELFRQYGFVFLFFSHEHEPIHVHVRGHNGDQNMSGMEMGLLLTPRMEYRQMT